MRETTTRLDARPRKWRWLVLAVVTLVATALALGLALHHDDGTSVVSQQVEQSLADTALNPDALVEAVATTSSPGIAGAMVCSLLILCCVALLLSKLRARAMALLGTTPRPADGTRWSESSAPAIFVSLTALSISRT